MGATGIYDHTTNPWTCGRAAFGGFTMHGPDGVDYPNKITYLEIVKPERLVYDNGGGGARGIFSDRVTFAEQGGKTRLTMRMVFRIGRRGREGWSRTHNAIEGANQTLDRFGEQLARCWS